MKKILLLLISCWSLAAIAQDNDTDQPRDPRSREKIRAAHAAYIAQHVELTPSEEEKFWPVYREYNQKRRELRQDLREARQSPANSESLLKLELQIQEQELALEKTYIEQLQQIISSEKILKLRQAEVDFRKLLLRQIQQRRRSGRQK